MNLGGANSAENKFTEHSCLSIIQFPSTKTPMCNTVGQSDRAADGKNEAGINIKQYLRVLIMAMPTVVENTIFKFKNPTDRKVEDPIDSQDPKPDF